MPGDAWQKRSTLRAYLSFMWTHPGKKLLFMGCELGQPSEWNHDGQIPWELLDDPDHGGIQRLVRALNNLYAAEPALHRSDSDPAGFEWIVGEDSGNMVFGYARRCQDGTPDIVTLLNMSPQPHVDYQVVMPRAGRWTEILNSDASIFGGSNVGNAGSIDADPVSGGIERGVARLTLPPLGALILRHG
jgi:1,4-alpha-glucan branching enzyme